MSFLASAVRAAGVGLFGLSLWAGPAILNEGVTRRVGEGLPAPPESSEQIRDRLAVAGAAAGLAVVGWLLARLGEAYRRPGGRRPRAARLAAELLLLLGGLGLWAALLVGWGTRLAAYEVAAEYRRLGTAAAVVGPVLLALGWVLYRLSACRPEPAAPPAPDNSEAGGSNPR